MMRDFVKYFFSPQKYTPILLAWSDDFKKRLIFEYFVVIIFALISALFIVSTFKGAEVLKVTLGLLLLSQAFYKLKEYEVSKNPTLKKPVFLDILFFITLNNIYVFTFAFFDWFFVREDLSDLCLAIVSIYALFMTTRSLSMILEMPYWRTFFYLFAFNMAVNKVFDLLPF